MNQSAFIKFFATSVAIGAIVGLLSFVFIWVIQFAHNVLWTSDALGFAENKPWTVVLISTVGGILMGFCVKFFGTNDKGIGFEGVLVTVKKDGALGLKQIKRVVINAYIGLITGASIGPESPLITLGGFCGDFIARKLKTTKEEVVAFITISLGGSMGVLVDSPIAGPIFFAESPPTKKPELNRMLIFASMVAASIGFGIYYLLGAPMLAGLQLIPDYDNFKFIDLLYGLGIGLVGTMIGVTLKYSIITIRVQSRRYLRDPILRGAVAGLIIGALGAMLPLVLFDGSAQLDYLVTNATQYSVFMLLLLAAVRLFSTAVALGGGYQGGNVFPTIFIAGAVGLAINMLFPFIPAPVAMVACISSAIFVFAPLPLFIVFLLTEISRFSLIPIMAMAMVSTYLYMTIKSMKNKTA